MLLIAALLFIFCAIFVFFLSFSTVTGDARPKLQLDPAFTSAGSVPLGASKKKLGIKGTLRIMFAGIAGLNTPLSTGPLGRRVTRDLSLAKIAVSSEEFLLIKWIAIGVLLWLSFFVIKVKPDLVMFSVLMSLGIGYYAPEFWLKAQTKKVKDAIVRELPDTVDLLGLCVNAGLDFMMALKYVVEKSRSTAVGDELKAMMQEIAVGKPRREALRDMARKYELPDLSTFARTLIQADRMGTSVTDALNILSEDMREARFRRGETMALKAPLKMLIPLLFFIFPVVAILVAGPIFLDFFQNNPLQNLGK